MKKITQLQAAGHVARQLPGALLRRGCRSVHAMDAANEHFPVILVHGYAGSESVWAPLRRELHAAGFGDVISVDYNSLFSDPVAVSREVARLAEFAVARTGAGGVHLVGHSLGGLIVRHALLVPGLAEITATAVTIATPHRGAPLARIAPGRCARIMQYQAPIALAQPPAQPVHWLAYYSDADRVVPAFSARLDDRRFDATNVMVPGCGHLTICRDPRVIESLVRELTRTEFPSVPYRLAAA
jgi:pimeloyl-ACP methyl ester carboxylesterase